MNTNFNNKGCVYIFIECYVPYNAISKQEDNAKVVFYYTVDATWAKTSKLVRVRPYAD